MENLYNDLKDSFDQIDLVQNFGTVTGVSGLTLSCTGVENTVMGSQCYVEDLEGHRHAAEVVGYKDGEVLLMPFGCS